MIAHQLQDDIGSAINSDMTPTEAIRATLEMVANGTIRIELCGHLEHSGHIKGFTLDKRKYQLVLQDETEDSVVVIIKERNR